MDIDAALDAPPPACDVTKPFGPPTLVPGVNTTAQETGGWMSPDQLTIYFDRTANMGDIYVATRSSVDGAFNVGTPLAGIDTAAFEGNESLTADGLQIFFASSASGTFSPHLYRSSRTSTSAGFGAPSELVSITDPSAEDLSPRISADGSVLYFASTRYAHVDTDLYVAYADATGTFMNPTYLASLNSSASDSFPVVSSDGLEIFFASDRGATGTGAAPNDIWHATRASPSGAFDPPTVESEVSDPTGNDGPMWLSQDRCVLVFSSDRAGGVGSYDIWMARRPP